MRLCRARRVREQRIPRRAKRLTMAEGAKYVRGQRQMGFDIITVFPGSFASYFSTSILKRAQERRLISVRVHGLRKWGKGKHRQLDDKPYGGGAGMVLMAEPILKAVTAALKRIKNHESGIKRTAVVLLSAKGRQFNQKMAYDWAKRYRRLILISGRYEGIDERVKTVIHDSRFRIHEISIGPYVLTDGDVAAMAVISAVARLIPGVIKLESLAEESHWNLLTKWEAGLGGKGIEYPHYTRPEVLRWKGKSYRVPRVLLSGNHARVRAWHLSQTVRKLHFRHCERPEGAKQSQYTSEFRGLLRRVRSSQ